jgi:hypothetical protein
MELPSQNLKTISEQDQTILLNVFISFNLLFELIVFVLGIISVVQLSKLKHRNCAI